MYISIYVYLCMYACTYGRCTYLCMYYVCMEVCMYVRMYVCMYVCTCVWVCQCMTHTHTHTLTHTHTHTHTHIHSHTHTLTHTHTHTLTHTVYLSSCTSVSEQVYAYLNYFYQFTLLFLCASPNDTRHNLPSIPPALHSAASNTQAAQAASAQVLIFLVFFFFATYIVNLDKPLRTMTTSNQLTEFHSQVQQDCTWYSRPPDRQLLYMTFRLIFLTSPRQRASVHCSLFPR